MDKMLADSHTERVANGGRGPWIVVRENGEVAGYDVSIDEPDYEIQATLVAESTIQEIECPTSPETDSSSSE